MAWAAAAQPRRRTARILTAVSGTVVWALVIAAVVAAPGRDMTGAARATAPAPVTARTASPSITTITTAATAAPPTTEAPARSPTAAPPSATGAGLDALRRIAVATPHSMDGYHRALFPHWIDLHHNGCDTRCEVLRSERQPKLPGLPGGGWLSIYDGYTTNNPDELDIDHVVALGEAWVSGADTWDTARRTQYANDPSNLLAVSAVTNRSKGDRDPAEWQPPNRVGWCRFATIWTTTKAKYGLTADPAEVRALTNMLSGCP